MPLIVDKSVQDAGAAIRDFVRDWNDSHVDKVAEVSLTCWVEEGRLYPVMQFLTLDHQDLIARDGE